MYCRERGEYIFPELAGQQARPCRIYTERIPHKYYNRSIKLAWPPPLFTAGFWSDIWWGMEADWWENELACGRNIRCAYQITGEGRKEYIPSKDTVRCIGLDQPGSRSKAWSCIGHMTIIGKPSFSLSCTEQIPRSLVRCMWGSNLLVRHFG